MSETKRIIVAAAIREGSLVCSVPRPGRHGDVMRQMATHGFPIPITGEQGFLTSDGLFVGRFEAKDIAVAAAQVGKTGLAELYSEDVW
jgi:hypothetical protein